MPATGSMNMEDPSQQEKIRRQSHEYVPTEGRHGTYRPKPYLHQSYPRMMDRTPAPKFEEFRGKPGAQELFEEAKQEWNRKVAMSIVNNKREEDAWLKAHKPE